MINKQDIRVNEGKDKTFIHHSYSPSQQNKLFWCDGDSLHDRKRYGFTDQNKLFCFCASVSSVLNGIFNRTRLHRTRLLSPCAISPCAIRLVLLLMVMLFTNGANKAWGQTTDYSGVYYIGAPGYNEDNTTTNYYLCPTENWYYYQADNNFTNVENGQPFLTTYLCRNGDYVSNKALWSVIKHGTSYYIKHYIDGKYLTYNGTMPISNTGRMRVHLESTDSPVGEKYLFNIGKNGNSLIISTTVTGAPDSKIYLNVTDGNKTSLQAEGKNDGPNKMNVGGIIGLWNDKNDNNGKWYLERAQCKAPTFSFDENTNQLTISCEDDGATIYYEFGTSTPTTSSVNKGSSPITITREESQTIIKAIAVSDNFDLPSDVSSFYLANCATPNIINSNGAITMSCETAGATIRYTIDGSDPTESSDVFSQFNLPLDFASTVIKARAFKPDEYGESDVASLNIEKCTQPTITNNYDGTVTVTSISGSTVYCNTSTSSTVDNPTTTSSLSGASPYTFTMPDGTIKMSARAYRLGYCRSDVQTYDVPYCATPLIKISLGTVSISCPVAGADIYYSTSATEDGDDWTGYSKYTSSFSLGSNKRVRAYATHVGYLQSEVSNFKGITISKASDINDMSGNYLIDSHFDSDVSIGTSSNPFTGSIDGQMQVISGLSHALVAYADGATIKNVILKDVNIGSGSSDGNVGAICNEATGATRIYNCGVLGTITETETSTTNEETQETTKTITVTGSSEISGTNYVGSIVGLLDGTSRVINCYSYAVITNGSSIGGIVGYNNVETTTPANATTGQKTMVMNCMFYGDITGGSSKSPIYNGNIITNVGQNAGVGNYNYFRAEARYVQDKQIDANKYNCALAAEERFLNRFEFFRHLLNSNRELAAWWATGSRDNKDEMMKWVLETSDRTITAPNTPYPYPILKPAYDANGNIIKYPSPVNIDAAHVEDVDTKHEHYNEGLRLGSLTVYINGVGSGAPDGAQILKENGNPTTSAKERYFSLNITDKDPERYNFNYYKVQLPYYNDCGTKNYTGNCVVTGWKIVEINGSSSGTGDFSITSDDATAENGVIKSTPYNFADRKCTNKDLYSVSGRVFSQGAYYDVPEGVTSITIEPYWGKAVYVSDPYLDRVYNQNMSTGYNVTTIGDGLRYNNGVSVFNNDNSQYVYTTIAAAVEKVGTSGNVYDNAIVLVGNTHNGDISLTNSTKSYTLMSVDLDNDHEPDYSYILRFDSRKNVHPVRVDFLNVIGLGMAQKSTGGTGTYNFGIMQPLGWFEVTNTGLFRVTQLEYDQPDRDSDNKTPMILHGGVIEQWVALGQKELTQGGEAVSYYHVGGNVWFKEFHIGAHQDNKQVTTPHPPISVSGGDYDNFYLTGYYNSPNSNYPDNAECYINGGRFGRVAGTGYQGIGTSGGGDNTGNIIWQIDNADIDEFFAGGLNAAHKAEGNITTVISNSRVDQFCGGPKFGDMNTGKTVFTKASNCTFNAFFGAGYGGNSYNRKYPDNKSGVDNIDWDSWVTQQYKNQYDATYKGVDTRIDYQFIPMSGNTNNVARLFVDYVSFSLATTHDVTSNLTNCTISTTKLGRKGAGAYDQCKGNFYGGGSLGKVDGDVSSTLTNCIVEGSVYGGGYSATLPPVSVMVKTGNKWFLTPPSYDSNLGAYLEAELPATESYTWEHVASVTTSNAIANKKLRTTENLDQLGTVMGNVTLTINGDDTKINGSVYGGGEESRVDGSTTVTVDCDGIIGTEGSGGVEFGNVYGGGKGKSNDPSLGLVKGNTTITISGEPTILHNVYGGGAFGSVGTFTGYDTTRNFPTGWSAGTGKCQVTINGGTYGTNGHNNGMVFGSSRGDDTNYNPFSAEDSILVNKLAWVYETEVVIGDSNPKNTTAPLIRGSLYGGGENGHVANNASVTLNKGTIGIESKESTYTDENGVVYKGPEYPYRGNVFGAGCGTDTYSIDHDDDEDTPNLIYYNPWAGVVLGNTTVTMNGGHVVHNIYGAGSMGSVGLFDIIKGEKKYELSHVSGGTCNVTVNGGKIGTSGMKMPDDWGYVFGAGRGDSKDPKVYPNVEVSGNVYDTNVTISGTALVYGSVYGGAENGHVLNNTNVTIAGGQIGVGVNMEDAYKESDFVNPLTTKITTSLKECASWDYGVGENHSAPYNPYDVLPLTLTKNGEGEITSYAISGTIEDATDGHTFYGNVFGGGSGLFPYGRNPNYNLDMAKEGYSDGLWLRSAGCVKGNSTVTITGGHILTSVYGGNECTDVDGKCTINMSGGTVGVPRTKEDIQAHPVTCYVFGAGKGDPRINFNQWTNVGSTEVNISGGIVYGSVFGGGEDGHVIGNAVTNISEAEGKTTIIGSVGTSSADGNIFGGGRGFSMTALTAGAVCGNVDINISGGTMLGTVFGGGRLASVGPHIVLVEEPHDYYGTLIPDGYNQVFGNPESTVTAEKFPADVEASGAQHGHITINISGGTIGSTAESDYSIGDVFGGCKGTTESTEPFGLSKSTSVTISGEDTHIYGTVYGGGEAGNVEEGVEVNINGGTIDKYVYGGGALASTNTKSPVNSGTETEPVWSFPYSTTVNLKGGSIGKDVFGGGLGRKAKDAVGTLGGDGYKPAVTAIAASVGGDVNVEVDGSVIKGRVFGCNNANGTPKGEVTVRVKKTVGWGDNDVTEAKNDGTKEKTNSVYELEAVYGGGNEAAYEPTSDDAKTNVIVDGCELSSIRYVYGGGNAATTPATSVTVNSCYEISYVFGGGNGADKLEDGSDNPGANVGYRDYSGDSNASVDSPDNRSYRESFKYGTGKAETRLLGGTIHNAFGGSNTLGNVREVAFSALDQKGACGLAVGEIYGAGNKAFMDAKIEVDLGCIAGLGELFGGAMEANVNSDVVLNVTSGTFGSVYGGNNKGGDINGTITVNVEETGCNPIIIGQLYGGGKDAPYVAPAPTEAHPYSPLVNVISATEIRKVFGGGYGTTAIVTGNPCVQINMEKGKPNGVEASDIGTIGTVFGGGYGGDVIGNTRVEIGTDPTKEVNITGSVYGGGENANVEGKTEVIIGKE